MKQRYTQYAGRRPYGISCLLTGTDFGGILSVSLTLASHTGKRMDIWSVAGFWTLWQKSIL